MADGVPQPPDEAAISRCFLGLLEHGARSVDAVRLLGLAAVLDVPLVELVAQMPNPERSAPTD